MLAFNNLSNRPKGPIPPAVPRSNVSVHLVILLENYGRGTTVVMKSKGMQPHRLQSVCAVSWMIIESHESLSYFCVFGCKVPMGTGSLNVDSKYSCFDMLLFYLLFICLIAEIPLKQTVDILHMLLIRLKNSKTILMSFSTFINLSFSANWRWNMSKNKNLFV